MLTAPVATVFLFFFFLFLSFFFTPPGLFFSPKKLFSSKTQAQVLVQPVRRLSWTSLGGAFDGSFFFFFSFFFLFFVSAWLLFYDYACQKPRGLSISRGRRKKKEKKTLVMSGYQECCICVCKRKREKRALSPENDTKTSPNFYLFIFWANCFRLSKRGVLPIPFLFLTSFYQTGWLVRRSKSQRVGRDGILGKLAMVGGVGGGVFLGAGKIPPGIGQGCGQTLIATIFW